MMASIRTVFLDAQYVDQDFTPTYISATTFSVTGNQTSAIHAGRRLKIYDATAGVATTIYATVVTASFTALTTIQVSADAGQLTSSLSSFALAILSRDNDSLPRGLPISASAIGTENLTVNGTTTASGAVSLLTTLSVSGATVLKGALSVGGAVNFGTTLTASGAVVMNTTLTVSGAAAFLTTLSVGGAATLASTLAVSGAATLNTTLSVSGASVLKGTLNVEGATSLSGAVALGTTLSVSGATVLKGALSVGGAVTLASTLSVSGNAIVTGFVGGAGSGGGEAFRIGDDAALHDVNTPNQAALKGVQDPNQAILQLGSSGPTLSRVGSTGAVLATSGGLRIGDTLSISGAAAVSGAVRMDSTLSVSGTIVAAQTAKAFANFIVSAGGILNVHSFNVSSISRSSTGTVRVNFSTAFSVADFVVVIGTSAGYLNDSATTTSIKFTITDFSGLPSEPARAHIVAFRSG